MNQMIQDIGLRTLHGAPVGGHRGRPIAPDPGCDAGVGRIPRFGREKVQKTSKPMAEKFGVENVKWRPAN